MNKNKIYCIAPPSILFSFTQDLSILAVLIFFVLLLLVIILLIKNKVKKQKILDKTFWKLLLAIGFLLLFNTFISSFYFNGAGYLLSYITSFAFLFLGLLLAKKYNLFKVRTALIITIFFSLLFILKMSVRQTDEINDVNVTDTFRTKNCGDSSWY